MAFKKGQSGNPKGRKIGSVSKRVKLAKLLDPHAEGLVDKLIQLALGGDVNALRICIERLIPKIRYEAIEVDLPNDLSTLSDAQLKKVVLKAVLSGQLSVSDAERLVELIREQKGSSLDLSTIKLPKSDPVQAAKIYAEIMQR